MSNATGYIVDNGNYDNKDLSQIFQPQNPSPYAVSSLILAEDFTATTYPSGWTGGGSGSVALLGGVQADNPGQVELTTSADNGVAVLYYQNILVSISTSQNIKMDFIVKTTYSFTTDNQQVYAGISTRVNPPAGSGEKNIYIGIKPTSGQVADSRFVAFINNTSSTSVPSADSDVATFNMKWEPNDWYHLSINIDIVSAGSANVTFTVKNLTADGQPTETREVPSSVVATNTVYDLLFEQRINSSTKKFYVDYIGYSNSYNVTRASAPPPPP